MLSNGGWQQSPLLLSSFCKIGAREGVPWLEVAAAGIAHRLELGTAIALELLAATGDRDIALASWPEHMGDGARWLDHAIDRFWSYFDGKTLRPAQFVWLEGVDLAKTGKAGPRTQEAAPHALVWLTTLGCNRACPFCFYEVFAHKNGPPPDATWSRASISRVISEMKSLGTSHLYLTGGEPLLRPDIVGVIEEAREARVRCHVATRLNIDQTMADRLGALDLGTFTYSLDAGDPKLADAMSGSRGFFSQATHSLRNLRAAGVPVVVNAVATRPVIPHLETLAELLASLGIARLEVSPYVPPITERRAATALIPKDEAGSLDALIERLSHEYRGQIDIAFGASGAVPGEVGGCQRNVCDVGFSELHVLPDGTATRCRYLPREDTLKLGSLETMSLKEVWESDRLRRLNAPPRAGYGGTSCAGCSSFSSCNERGRCFVSAIAQSRQLFAPDQFCEYT